MIKNETDPKLATFILLSHKIIPESQEGNLKHHSRKASTRQGNHNIADPKIKIDIAIIKFVIIAITVDFVFWLHFLLFENFSS